MAIGINTSSQVTPEQLQSFGVNVDDINSQVDQEIATQQANTITADEFYKKSQDIFKSGKIPNKTHEEIYYELMDFYKRKGKYIEGINIDEDLATYNEQKGATESETPQEEISVNEEVEAQPVPESGIGAFIQETTPLINKGLAKTIGGLENIRKSAAAQIPEIGGDIIGGILNILTPKEYEGKIGNVVKKWGEEGKSSLQDILGVDKDAWTNTVGEVGADISAFFTPTGVAGLVSKFPKVIKEINLVANQINKFQKANPKIYNAIGKVLNSKLTGNAVEGGVGGAKAGLVSEGEVTPTGIVGGAVANTLVGKVLGSKPAKEITQKINKSLGKLITKNSPSKITKEQLDKEISTSAKGMDIVKKWNPNIKVEGDDAVSNFLTASAETKKKLGKNLETLRGQGGVDFTDVVNWADRMKMAFTSPNFTKKLTPQELKEFNALNRGDTTETVAALQKVKDNLLTKLKNNKTSLDLADDYIINTNKNISELYNKTTNSPDKTLLVIKDAVNSKMKKKLDDTIKLSTGKGDEFRRTKKDYQAVRTIEDNLNKIYAQLARKKDVSLTDYTDVFTFGNLAKAAFTQDPISAAQSGLMLAIRKKFTQMNDPNYVLEKSFKLLDKVEDVAPKKGVKITTPTKETPKTKTILTPPKKEITPKDTIKNTIKKKIIGGISGFLGGKIDKKQKEKAKKLNK